MNPNPKQVRLSDTTVIGLHFDQAEIVKSSTKPAGEIVALVDLPKWRGWKATKKAECAYRHLRDVVGL